MRLYCLPHAGGAARHFAGWSRWLPQYVTVVAVDLPGHGSRHRLPLIRSWPDLVDDLTRMVAATAAGPYALAGHSLGALAAFEVARARQAAGDPPELLVVAGRNGPSVGQAHPPLHPLPDAELVEALDRLGGLPDSARRLPDIMRFFLPALRADLRLAETYTRPPGPPLACPIAAFAGRHDLMTDLAGVLTWSAETTNAFDLAVLDAGHFMLDHPDFMSAMVARLGRLAGAARPWAAPAPAAHPVR